MSEKEALRSPNPIGCEPVLRLTFVPEGRDENSPMLQHWVLDIIGPESRKGRLNCQFHSKR